MSEAEVYEFARLNGFELHKANERLIVFRRFPDGQHHEPIISTAEEDSAESCCASENCLQVLTGDDIDYTPAPKYRMKFVTDESITRLFD